MAGKSKEARKHPLRSVPTIEAVLAPWPSGQGAATLPANPLGYLTAYVGATAVKIPYYKAS